MKTLTQVPNWLSYSIVLTCIAPFLLNLFGVSFASNFEVFDPQKVMTLEKAAVEDVMFSALSGSYTHTLLEWSAFMCAILTVILAFTIFKHTTNFTILVLSVALFFSGVMDGFHTLAADRLINATASNQNLIPFTWAISRSFNALILVVGASIFLFFKVNLATEATEATESHFTSKAKTKMITLFGACVTMGLLAFGIIHISATSAVLPQTQFPNALVSRPYDVFPGLIYLSGILIIFPKFYTKYPSVFSHALLLSMVPQIMTQLHMTFGSSALFDNDFNIAHFLKIFAYLVPFLGLCIDYHNKQIELKEEISRRQIAKDELKHAYDDLELQVTQRTSELSRSKELIVEQNKALQLNANLLQSSNQELVQFVVTVSRNLKDPSSQISSYGAKLSDKYALEMSIRGQQYLKRMITASKQMEGLTKDLLNYSDVLSCTDPFVLVNLNELALELKDLLTKSIEEGGALFEISELPMIEADRAQIKQVFQCLLSNAIKYCLEDVPPVIKITAKVDPRDCVLTFTDNGQGFDDLQAEQLFQPFQRLHSKKVDGTGMGLALVKKIIERHNGKIVAYGIKDEGAKFIINLPLKQSSNGTSLSQT